MSKATTTTTRSTAAAPKARATETTAGPAFDAKANKAAAIKLRASGKAGGGENLQPFTVNANMQVLAGGIAYGPGETIHLGEVDAERMLDSLTVTKGADVKLKGVPTTAETQAATDAQEDADAAQRAADEAASADKEAANLAAGKLSGVENR